MEINLITFYIILGFLIFLFGASIGSVLNVVGYRVPLGISICMPSSFCLQCQKKISAVALIPVFGYFFTKGRCAYCDQKISLQYPFVELLAGILTIYLFFHFF